MSFHFSPISSDRCQRLLAALRDAPLGMTTMQINNATQSTRASSDVSELRANGYGVEAEYVGTNTNGRRVYRYRLTSEPNQFPAGVLLAGELKQTQTVLNCTKEKP